MCGDSHKITFGYLIRLRNALDNEGCRKQQMREESLPVRRRLVSYQPILIPVSHRPIPPTLVRKCNSKIRAVVSFIKKRVLCIGFLRPTLGDQVEAD